MLKRVIFGMLIFFAVVGTLGFVFGIYIPAKRIADGWKPDEAFNVEGYGIRTRPQENADSAMLAEFKGAKPRWAKLDEFPPGFVEKFLKVEDQRYYEHSGIDWVRVAGALIEDITTMRMKEGAGTITMQLVREAVLRNKKRSLFRKFYEAVIALELEKRFTKAEILSMHLSFIDLGVRNNKPTYGYLSAADGYYGRPLKDLTLDQQAMLVGLAKGVGVYNPASSSEVKRTKAKERRDLILSIWLKADLIGQSQYDKAVGMPIAVAKGRLLGSFMADQVMEELEKQFADRDLSHTTVYSTLDVDVQKYLEESVAAKMPLIEKRFKGVQFAGLVMNGKTGEVLGLMGSKNYQGSQLNRAARPQPPGSTAKTIAFASALQNGLEPFQRFLDVERTFVTASGQLYTPGNSHPFSGQPVTAWQALVESNNSVTIEVSRLFGGYEGVASMATSLGIPGWQPYPSTPIGTGSATVYQIASAYTALINRGQRVEPRFIHSIRNGEKQEFEPEFVSTSLKPETADLLTAMLADVPDHGTATMLRKRGFTLPVAVKTGSSQHGWMVAYTPGGLLLVMYVGYDDPAKHGTAKIFGADTAGEIVADVLLRMSASKNFRSFFQGAFPAGPQPPAEALPVAGEIPVTPVGEPGTVQDIPVRGSAPAAPAPAGSAAPDIPVRPKQTPPPVSGGVPDIPAREAAPVRDIPARPRPTPKP